MIPRWLWWVLLHMSILLYGVNWWAFGRYGVWHPDVIVVSTLMFAGSVYKLLQIPKRATRRRVYVETPFRADTPEGLRLNREYLLRCMRDSVMRGEAPFASHLLYVQFLDDDILWEREAGLSCGFAWATQGEATVVYTDHGISSGMWRGIGDARSRGRPIEYRTIT